VRAHLGEQYVDPVTGFTGIATARTEYLGLHVSVLLEARHPEKAVQHWFPEGRLAAVDGKAPGRYA
jgi:hypothetical protein